MSKATLLLAAAAAALLGGCARRQQIYFRPIGDPVRYGYTYYPELSLAIPPDSKPTAEVAVGARGIIEALEDDGSALVVNVRLIITNPTDTPIEVRRDEQLIEDLDGREYEAAAMRVYREETDTITIRPGLREVIRLEFRSSLGPPFGERLSFVYRFRYAIRAQSWPEDVRFVQVMPGEIKPPPIWDGVIIIRF